MTDPRKIRIQVLLNFRSHRRQDSADHVTRWNTIRQVRNLRQLFIQNLKQGDQFFKSREVRLTGRDLWAGTQSTSAVFGSALLCVRVAQHQPLFRAFAASADLRSLVWLAAFSAE
jgi:hypothetical protein